MNYKGEFRVCVLESGEIQFFVVPFRFFLCVKTCYFMIPIGIMEFGIFAYKKGFEKVWLRFLVLALRASCCFLRVDPTEV